MISEDLTTDNKEHQKGDYGGLTLDISGAEVYNSLLTIAPSSLDKNIIWTGSDDGQIYLTTDGCKRWKSVSNNIINFPVKPGTPMDEWYKTAKKSDYLELLVGMAGFKEDALKDLSESELKELLQYPIDTGGFGG